MFYPTNKVRGALIRAQLECSVLIAGGQSPDVLVEALAEIAAVLAMTEPGLVS